MRFCRVTLNGGFHPQWTVVSDWTYNTVSRAPIAPTVTIMLHGQPRDGNTATGDGSLMPTNLHPCVDLCRGQNVCARDGRRGRLLAIYMGIKYSVSTAHTRFLPDRTTGWYSNAVRDRSASSIIQGRGDTARADIDVYRFRASSRDRYYYVHHPFVS
jgi:hypothetical protein